MKKIKVTTPLKDILTEEILTDEGKTLDFRLVSVRGLLTPKEALSGEQQLLRYNLALRIAKEEEVNLSSEEAVLIKSSIEGVYGPLIYGQIHSIIED